MPDIIIDFDWKAIEKMEADFNKPVFIDFDWDSIDAGFDESVNIDFDWNRIIELEKPFDFNFDFIFDNGAGNDSNYQGNVSD